MASDKAIILFSGGIDSTVLLSLAIDNGKSCVALSFDYGQKHRVELEAAKKITTYYQVLHKIISIDPTVFSKSALLGDGAILKGRSPEEIHSGEIPSSYVPARNTLFLSYALGFAEIHEANEIHFGANALDANPYPDCRPEFINAYQQVANLATKQSVEGSPPQLITPLIHWDKVTIIKRGLALNTPLELTFSCYDPTTENLPCKECDACKLRDLAFSSLHANR